MIDPKSLTRDSSPESRTSPFSSGKKAHPWAWIVGIIVALLLVWGFFGMDHLKPNVEPDTAPSAATLVVE